MAALDELHAHYIEHETREQVDDLIIHTREGTDVYVQAKRQLSWSLEPSSDFAAAIGQFARQHASGRRGLYVLATTSGSSRRITADLPAALLAYRSGMPESFLRDQPASFAKLLTDLGTAIKEFAKDLSSDEINNVLMRMRVARLDLDDGEPLQQALRMRLGGAGFVPDDLVWTKLIAHSLDASRRRITLNIDGISESLVKGGLGQTGNLHTPTEEDADAEILNFKDGEIACGKDWLLGVFDGEDAWTAIELYRFDERCREKTEYAPEGKAIFGSKALNVAVRSSAYAGLLRYFDRNPGAFEDWPITLIGANIDDDPDASECALRHEQLIREALARNSKPRHCIRCGMFIAELAAEVVETFPGQGESFEAGLVHERCRFGLDRVIAQAQMPFFKAHPELVGFDVESWIAAAEKGGQRFMGAVLVAGRQIPTIMWSRPARRPTGGLYVIRLDLEGGGDAYVTVRGALQRYSRAEAEGRARKLAGQLRQARERVDPFCIILEGQKSGNRSGILSMFGLSEDIRPVCNVQVEHFSQSIGARYPDQPPFYAPLSYLTDPETGEIFYSDDAAVVLTNPMALARHLMNWQEVGFEVPELRLAPLLTDADVDAFMEMVDAQEAVAVVDPVFAGDPPALLSGATIIPTERLLED